MVSRCNRHRPVTVAPFDVGRLDVTQLDAVLSVMAGLDDPTIVLVQPDGNDHALFGVRELPFDPRCIGAGMFGMRAPAGTALVGLTFSGLGQPLPGDLGPFDPGSNDAFDEGAVDGDLRRVDVVVTADGATDARIHDDHGFSAPSGTPTGVVIDALHRLIGLPTPGATPPLTELVAGLWMAEILRICISGRRPGWAEVVAALDGAAVGSAPDRFTAATPADVAATMQQLTDEASWQDLHRAAAIGRMAAPDLSAEEAAWMDTAMFARWMTESFPTVALVRDELRVISALDVLDGVDAVLERLDPVPWSASHDDDEDDEDGDGDGDGGPVEHLEAG